MQTLQLDLAGAARRVDSPAPVEGANAVDPHARRRCGDRGQRGGDVLGMAPVDLPDETHRDVQLLVVLPTRARHAAHRVEQQGADRGRRAQGDEKAVHGAVTNLCWTGCIGGVA